MDLKQFSPLTLSSTLALAWRIGKPSEHLLLPGSLKPSSRWTIKFQRKTSVKLCLTMEYRCLQMMSAPKYSWRVGTMKMS